MRFIINDALFTKRRYSSMKIKYETFLKVQQTNINEKDTEMKSRTRTSLFRTLDQKMLPTQFKIELNDSIHFQEQTISLNFFINSLNL